LEKYDLAIIGGGPGGYEAALAATGYGLKTVLIEQAALGGTCLNRGCIPTKTLLHVANLLREVERAADFGLTAGNVQLDMMRLQAYKESVVGRLRTGMEQRLRQHHITLQPGRAHIESAGHMIVQGTETIAIEAKAILIATGSQPVVPPIPGHDLPGVVTSDALLSLTEVPRRLVIIGGGVIGAEFASMYAAMGSQVTIIEALERILLNLDKEMAQSAKLLLKKQGVAIHTAARVTEILSEEDGLRCCYTENEQPETAAADVLLLAVGRYPCTEGLFADGIGIAIERGHIVTDEYYRTSVPGIYAIGDVNGGIQLAHAAAAQGRNAAAVIAGQKTAMETAWVPSCIYLEPELAAVGLTLDQARAQGKKVVSHKYSMGANGKTVLSGGERGYLRVVADAASHQLLGAQLMCSRASDIVSEFTAAIVAGQTLEQLGSIIRPHPTFSEAVGEVVRGEN